MWSSFVIASGFATHKLQQGLCNDRGLCSMIGPLKLELIIGFPVVFSVAALLGVWLGVCVCIGVLGSLATLRVVRVCCCSLMMAALAWYTSTLLIELVLEAMSGLDATSAEPMFAEFSAHNRLAAEAAAHAAAQMPIKPHAGRCAGFAHVRILTALQPPPSLLRRSPTCHGGGGPVGSARWVDCRLGVMCLNHSAAAPAPCDWQGQVIAPRLPDAPLPLYETSQFGLGSAVYNRLLECSTMPTAAAKATAAKADDSRVSKSSRRDDSPALYLITFDVTTAIEAFEVSTWIQPHEA